MDTEDKIREGLIARNRIVLILGPLLFFLLIVFSFVSAVDSSQIISLSLNWFVTVAFTILLNEVVVRIPNSAKNEKLGAMPLAFFLSGTIGLTLFTLTYSRSIEFGSMQDIVVLPVHGLIASIRILIVYVFLKELKGRTLTQIEPIRETAGKKVISNEPIVEDSSNLSGFENVLSLISARARRFSKTTTFSLMALIAVIALGGGASFGTLALDKAAKIREMESERLKLIMLVSKLEKEDIGDSSAEILGLVNVLKEQYGEHGSYDDLMLAIEKESVTSWQDIAMRVTIAALTLFLVQIFFSIYKYSQQQAVHLENKVELMYLYQDSGASIDELRRGLLSKIESNPRFDKSPTSPTEQVANVLRRTNDKT